MPDISTNDKPIAYAKEGEDREKLILLARRLDINLVFPPSQIPSNQAVLELSSTGLSLVYGKLRIKGDFEPLLSRLRPQNLKTELLVRAARIKKASEALPLAVDATAGLGEDSLLLAAAGYRVMLFERDKIIAALLADALLRSKSDPMLCEYTDRMELIASDSISLLPKLNTPPELVYLDPMFPARTKSALVKKKFQLFHLLEQPCGDEKALIDAAYAAKPKKIIIKRPSKGPYLAGIKPSYSIEGSGIRYDCIVL